MGKQLSVVDFSSAEKCRGNSVAQGYRGRDFYARGDSDQARVPKSGCAPACELRFQHPLQTHHPRIQSGGQESVFSASGPNALAQLAPSLAPRLDAASKVKAMFMLFHGDSERSRDGWKC